MTILRARNVNDAYVNGLWWLKTAGVHEDSRNGKVIVAPGPVLTIYQNSWERVLFNERRDANPFFHLAECIWMLAGSDRVAWLSQFNSHIASFSDDGEMFHGAYGERWRVHFGFDQIRMCIRLLIENPNNRQVVLTMWDPSADFGAKTNDIPCNTHIYFRTIGNKLDMTVCCRSNDVVWGAYGANAVHFSFLHEFIAGAANLSIGKLYQFSNNFHIYERHWHLLAHLPTEATQPYANNGVSIYPLMEKGKHCEFLEDCGSIIRNEKPSKSWFLIYVAWPLLVYYVKRKKEPITLFPNIPACDWGAACDEWVARHNKENQDGPREAS